MRKIYLEQKTPEWLLWRKGLLTATDAAGLMGASPYTTPYKLWQRKLGLLEEQEVTPAMVRGNEDEPIARSLFITQTGIQMTPGCVESTEYNFIGASLDGISNCGRFLLEIKSNGSQYHDKLESEGIPVFHVMQMQHQLLAADADICYYCSYNQGNIIVKEVHRDEEWLEKYIPKAKEFWRCVVMFEAPPLSDRDYVDMSKDPMWDAISNDYCQVAEKIKELEDLKDCYKKQLLTLCEGSSCRGGGIKVIKKSVKGRVDYDLIPEIKNINLDQYRKPSIETWTITIDKK